MPAKPLFEPGRLLGFCDAVIAIAITILVLGLEVPSAHEVPEKELPTFLYDSFNSILGYVVSFLVIGMYWVQHYAMFHYVVRANRTFVLINGLFLLFVSFIPFPTGLLPVYRYDEFAVVLYGATQMACGFSLIAIWVYATKGHRLVVDDIPQAVVTSMTRRLALTPIICVVAIGMSFINVLLGKWLFLLIPLAYFSHRTVDQGEG